MPTSTAWSPGLLADQLGDGGWNCWTEHGATVSSFDSTICVLEGLLEYELASGGVPVSEARLRGEEYLLERRLFRRRSTGEVAAERWLQFSWPPRWHYDVLRALDHLRRSGRAPDPRAEEAVRLVRDKGEPDGTWLLENTHPGETWFGFEDGDGLPSRWNTLRALRVLDWYDRRRSASRRRATSSAPSPSSPGGCGALRRAPARRSPPCEPTGRPRISGIEAAFEDGELTFGSMPNAREGADLRRDPRFALHSATVDPVEGSEAHWPGEAKISGRAVHASAGRRRSPTQTASAPTSPRSCTPTSTRRPQMLVVEW